MLVIPICNAGIHLFTVKIHSYLIFLKKIILNKFNYYFNMFYDRSNQDHKALGANLSKLINNLNHSL